MYNKDFILCDPILGVVFKPILGLLEMAKHFMCGTPNQMHKVPITGIFLCSYCSVIHGQKLTLGEVLD